MPGGTLENRRPATKLEWFHLYSIVSTGKCCISSRWSLHRVQNSNATLNYCVGPACRNLRSPPSRIIIQCVWDIWDRSARFITASSGARQ
eukprot:6172667-Pleurochrysis_carterae.AAC.2